MVSISVKENLAALIVPLLDKNGYELVKLEVFKRSKGFLIRLFIDREAGVGIQDCEFISHGVCHILDKKAEHLLPDYTLEVSSPGLDRPLLKQEDYQRFKNSRVKLVLKQEMDNRKHFEGIIKDFSSGVVELEAREGLIRIPYTNIQKANLKPSMDEIFNKPKKDN